MERYLNNNINCDKIHKEEQPAPGPSKPVKSNNHNNNNNRTVFVGNISFKATKAEIKDALSVFGKMANIYLLKDHAKGRRFRGMALVTYTTHQAAKQAVSSAEKIVLQNRELRIFWAEEKKSKKFQREEKKCVVSLEQGSTRLLTDDALFHILKYLNVEDLTTAAKICSRWKHLVDSCLASKRKLSFQNTFQSFDRPPLTLDGFRNILKPCAAQLKELDMSAVAHIVDYQYILLIANNCPRLERLLIPGSHVDDSDLKLLASSCSKLKYIDLSRCCSFGEKGLWWLLHFLKDMTHLDISMNPRITGKCFSQLGTKFQVLCLNGCKKLGEYGYEQIGKKCSNLKELSLKNILSMPENALRVVFNDCVVLTKLAITNSIVFEEWSAIGSLHFLVELDLSINSGLTNEIVRSIAVGCPSLRVLNISGPDSYIDDEGLCYLTTLDQLIDVDISYILGVTDESVGKLARLGRLVSLNCLGCFGVSSATVIDLLNFCVKLRNVDVSACDGVGNGILQPLRDHLQQRIGSQELRVVIGGTSVDLKDEELDHPLLKLILTDCSNKSYVRSARGYAFEFDIEEDDWLDYVDDVSDQFYDDDDDELLIDHYEGDVYFHEYDGDWT